MGSKSAGVGVCFLSIRRWKKLLTQAGYNIEMVEDPKRAVKRLPLTEQFFYFICRAELCQKTEEASLQKPV
jgi:hypothetical protein